MTAPLRGYFAAEDLTPRARRTARTTAVAAATLVIAASLTMAGCGNAKPNAATTSTTLPAPQGPTSATPSTTPPAGSTSATSSSPASTPTLALADAEHDISRGMVTAAAMKVVGLSPSVTDPVGPPSAWSFTCNKQMTTDRTMIASGYQQWLNGKQTMVLETLDRFRPGAAGAALAEAAAIARSCASFDAPGLGTVSVLPPIKSTATLLTYCMKGPKNYFCVRASLRGDYVSQMLAFGAAPQDAADRTNLVSGLADAAAASANL